MSLTEETVECKVEMEKLDDSMSSHGDRHEIMEELQGQDDNSDSEFEYEFLPSIPIIKKERSATPDPAEAVLDELYEAAQEGDSSKLVDLMFTQMKPNVSDENSKTMNDEDADKGLLTDINQNHAIMNMIKRKNLTDKDKNEESKSKKIKLSMESPEGQFSTVRNIGNLKIGNLMYSNPAAMMDASPAKPTSSKSTNEKPRRKNAYRTPTPPPLTPPSEASTTSLNKKKAFRNSLRNLPTFGVNSYIVSMGNSYVNMVNGNLQNENTNSSYNADHESEKNEEKSNSGKERNLIDYTVLTKALTNTLEKKLREDGDNDVKIVIFCNNKPIQSFSVKSNKPVNTSPSLSSPSATSAVNSPNIFPCGSNVASDQPSNFHPPGTMLNTDGVNPIKVSNIIRANAHLFPTNTIPTVGDVKAVLERNKKIASESLARFGSVYKKRSDTSKITFGNNSNIDNNLAMTMSVTNRLAFAFNGPIGDKVVNTTNIPITLANIMNVPVADKVANASNKTDKVANASNETDKVANASNETDKVANASNETDKVANASNETDKVVNSKNETDSVANTTNVTDKVVGSNSESNDELNDGKLVINDTVATVGDNGDEDPAVDCDLCGKTFKCQRYLYRHKIRLHCNSKRKPVPVLLSRVLGNHIENGSEQNVENQTLIHNIPDTFSVLSKEMLDGMENSKESDTADESEVKMGSAESDANLDNESFQTKPEISGRDKLAQLLRSGQLKGLTADEIYDCTIDKSKPMSCDSPVNEKGLIEPVYVCEQCGKFYRARKTLKDHFFREHAKSKEDEPLYLYVSGNKYQCPICFKVYQSGSELVEHTKRHTGDLQSSCCLCGKVFTSVHVLRKHMETVHTDLKPRPFQCELCDYAATNKWHLKEHYRRHTGEQPYKCPICMKPFSHQGTMNRHCKTIHKIDVPSQRPYTKNNIFDLPDLPFSNTDSPTTASQDEGNDLNEQSPVEYEEVSMATNQDVDLSIVKVEPNEVSSE
ncbi:Up in starvation [Mactra antiquata]